MIPRMNLFLGKGLKVSEDLEKYYEERNKSIDSVLQELRWLDQHCFENTIIRRRNLSQLAGSLNKLLVRLDEKREMLSSRNLKKINKAEEIMIKAIQESSIVLKEEGNIQGSIQSKSAMSIVNRLCKLLEKYKTIEL